MNDPNICVTLPNVLNHTRSVWYTGMYPSVLAMVILYREDKPVHFPLEIWDTSYIVSVIICHKRRRDLLSACTRTKQT